MVLSLKGVSCSLGVLVPLGLSGIAESISHPPDLCHPPRSCSKNRQRGQNFPRKPMFCGLTRRNTRRHDTGISVRLTYAVFRVRSMQTTVVSSTLVALVVAYAIFTGSFGASFSHDRLTTPCSGSVEEPLPVRALARLSSTRRYMDY